jgi:two-component system, cell cycle sensor histidine kinase and response regulator CckA
VAKPHLDAPRSRSAAAAAGIGLAGSNAAVAAFGCALAIVVALTGRRRDEPSAAPDDLDESMYQRLVQGIPAIVYIDAADDTGSTMYMSPQVEKVLGYTVEEWFSSPDFFMSILHPDDRERLASEISFNNAGNDNRSEYRVIAKDGRVVWFYDESTVEYADDGTVVCTRGCMTDITDRVRAEEEVRAAQQRYQDLVDELPVTLYIDAADSISSTMFVSAQVERLCGYRPDEITADPALWQRITHPDDWPAVEQSIEAGNRGLATSIEYRIIHRDGHSVWVLDTGRPALDADGNTLFVRGYLIDVTERREVEAALRSSEEQLRQAQKMEALGRIAGGVAHDFNNLLTVISGNSAFLLDDPELPEWTRESLDDIAAAGARAAGLTRQLLAFSRKQMLHTDVLHLAVVVREVERMLQRVIGEDVTLVTQVDDDVPPIRADRTQIEQVILNLVVNARDAVEAGGEIRLIVRGDTTPNPGFVVLAVEDDGVGVPAEIQARIFDPFFTTKEPGKGTGLGLSTVIGIVQQSGGTIDLTSSPGQCTRFEVRFPSIVEERSEPGTRRVTASGRVRGVDILVVEDEEAVRELVVRSLTRDGHRVVAAASPQEAIEYAERGGAIDLLLTDVVMPEMSGRDLAEALSAVRPGLRVLYVSGCCS